MIASAIISILQLNDRTTEPTVKVVCALKDIKQGETIVHEHLSEIDIHPRNQVGSYSAHKEDFLGRVAMIDIPKSVPLSTTYFISHQFEEVQKGKALTAIKLLPDSAICWIAKPGSLLDVYFVDQKGEMEILGTVKLIQSYDQNMGSDDLLFYAVVEGSEEVIAKIVQRRGLGRIEVVKTQ